jgi:hypothetical protein
MCRFHRDPHYHGVKRTRFREARVFCRRITHPTDLEAIQTLRYRVLVEEMGRPHPNADVAAGRMAESLDAGAVHLGAYEQTPGRVAELVGALRINLPGHGDLRAFGEYHPAILAKQGPRTGVVSRLVTAPHARGGWGGPGLALAIEAYRIALAERLDAVEIDCHASLIGFFEWLGFVVYRRFAHPDFGDVALLRIHPFDRAALEAAGSPLVAVFDEASAGEAGVAGVAGARRAQA